MTRNTLYMIYRVGSNAANQSMCQRAPVATVRAASRAAAVELANEAPHFTLYNNQHLEAVPYSRTPQRDREDAGHPIGFTDCP